MVGGSPHFQPPMPIEISIYGSDKSVFPWRLEAHPCGFKWITEAKGHRGTKLIVVDPRYTRAASVADYGWSAIKKSGSLVREAILRANGSVFPPPAPSVLQLAQ